MRNISALVVLFSVFLLTSEGPVRAADRFLSGIEDVPLAPALNEIAASSLVFETADGRIVQISANGPGPAAQILTFYGRTLPQLGWSPAGKGGWLRDRELLTITVKNEGAGIVVEFSLQPAPTKTNPKP